MTVFYLIFLLNKGISKLFNESGYLHKKRPFYDVVTVLHITIAQFFMCVPKY